MRAAVVLVALVGCGPKAPPPEIVGPFTGPTYRFAVDHLKLPMSRFDYSVDLNGDAKVDNAAGTVIGALAAAIGSPDADATVDAPLGTGVVAVTVEITTDDAQLRNDPTVGVRWIDGSSPASAVMGAALIDGTIQSNRALFYSYALVAFVSLPVFDGADPMRAPVVGADVKLVSDGAGGFDGELHGAYAIAADSTVLKELWRALVQNLDADRSPFGGCVVPLLDNNHDGMITYQEFSTNSIIQNALSPDVQLFAADGSWKPNAQNAMKDSLSLGFGFHLVRCVDENCALSRPPSCDDRSKNGDETDLDCGGSCRPCVTGQACITAKDCASPECTNGKCGAATCTDGKRDGDETDVDCGGRCPPCAVYNQVCRSDGDCLSPMVCNGPGFCGGNCGKNVRHY